MADLTESADRSVPFFCPYCGDEDLRPDGELANSDDRNRWRCDACTRTFVLRRVRGQQ